MSKKSRTNEEIQCYVILLRGPVNGPRKNLYLFLQRYKFIYFSNYEGFLQILLNFSLVGLGNGRKRVGRGA